MICNRQLIQCLNSSLRLFTNTNKLSQFSLIKNNNPAFMLSSSKFKNYKIISDPKDVSKLIFNDEGRCKIY